MNLAKLITQVEKHIIREVEQDLLSNAAKAKALRWILRGLLPQQAIRKVRVDEEISQNQQKKKR